MADSIEEKFLTEGITRYAEAAETLQTFETMLEGRLRAIVAEYSSDAFVPKKVVPVKTGHNQGTWGRCVWAWREGVLRSQPVFLEFGLWWRDGEVAFYGGFRDANEKLVACTYQGKDPRIKVRKWSSKDWLFLSPDSARQMDLDRDIGALLDALMNSPR